MVLARAPEPWAARAHSRDGLGSGVESGSRVSPGMPPPESGGEPRDRAPDMPSPAASVPEARGPHDPAGLADRVYALIMERLTLERESLGL
ncbi:hypothetical protein JCM14469_16050 [Desulfatiferula olefinivorans]